ncbi:hypothetical protein MLD38_024751 [Melastoma candidum]|uniref:Uncharacterized protein n=1 Tax=Melastoma candidum TaxID=119954 RepID=A0ACB9NW29_9MYRT|nr:hypothetical protein MLD38_024751 [Melastoma candidum]
MPQNTQTASNTCVDRNNLCLEWPIRVSIPISWKLPLSPGHEQPLASVDFALVAELNGQVPQDIVLCNRDLRVATVRVSSPATSDGVNSWFPFYRKGRNILGHPRKSALTEHP